MKSDSWVSVDRRTTQQRVTYYRRRMAATDTPAEQEWYALHRDSDKLEWKNRVSVWGRVNG